MEKLTTEQRSKINEHLRGIMSVSNVFEDALETMQSFESRMEENLFFWILPNGNVKPHS